MHPGYMQALARFIYETWASVDFGIWEVPGTNPPWIPRDENNPLCQHDLLFNTYPQQKKAEYFQGGQTHSFFFALVASLQGPTLWLSSA